MKTRAQRIVWGFLIGVIILEGWGILASFGRYPGGFLHGVTKYILQPHASAMAWLAAAALTAGYSAYSAMGSPIIRKYMLQPATWSAYWQMRLVAIPMALISGFFEEALFRKTLMDYALHHGATVGLQVTLTALMFGFVHAIWGIAGGSIRGALSAMLSTGILGAMLGVVYVVGGRSIGPCIAAHVAINLLIEPWLIITAATGSWERRGVRTAAKVAISTP